MMTLLLNPLYCVGLIDLCGAVRGGVTSGDEGGVISERLWPPGASKPIN